MKYSIRITLESKNDVIREIEIDSNCFLNDLHFYIIELFDLDSKELASFYVVDSELELQEEIPLFSFEENNSTMESIKLNSLLIEKNDKLIYVFDYMKMWRFLIELIEIESYFKEKKCTLKIGKVPNEAPEICFFNNDQNKNTLEEDDLDEYEYY
tara:strand:+ start:1388 stop:1852 length:465 start_codon:yes stop_codon:yes gene_type:complete